MYIYIFYKLIQSLIEYLSWHDLLLEILFVEGFNNKTPSTRMETRTATITNYWNRPMHSLQGCTNWNPSCCSVGAAVASPCLFCVCVCMCVRACTNTFPQHHTSSWLFPQSYQCLFSYCEKPIAPAFFAYHSLTKIYHYAYPINTSSHYVNWLQIITMIILTGSPSLSFVFGIPYMNPCTF